MGRQNAYLYVWNGSNVGQVGFVAIIVNIEVVAVVVSFVVCITF